MDVKLRRARRNMCIKVFHSPAPSEATLPRAVYCVCGDDRDVKRAFFFCSLTKRKSSHSFPVRVSFILCTPHRCFENVHLNAHPILGKRFYIRGSRRVLGTKKYGTMDRVTSKKNTVGGWHSDAHPSLRGSVRAGARRGDPRRMHRRYLQDWA